jgi:hypothetical protein
MPCEWAQPNVKTWADTRATLLAFRLLGLLFDPEDGGNIYLRSGSKLLPDCTVLYPRKYYFSNTDLIKRSVRIHYIAKTHYTIQEYMLVCRSSGSLMYSIWLIMTRLLRHHFIFNTIPLFILRWEIQTYTGIFFRKVACTWYDVTSFVQWMNFNCTVHFHQIYISHKHDPILIKISSFGMITRSLQRLDSLA